MSRGNRQNKTVKTTPKWPFGDKVTHLGENFHILF